MALRKHDPIGKFVVLGLVLMIALFGVVGSDKAARNQQKRSPSRQDNSRLVEQVRHELMMLPDYSVFDNLEFAVQGDRVTLSGQVTRPTLKSEAKNVVKHLEAVRSVTDN